MRNLIFAVIAFFWVNGCAQAAPKIVVSILPLHSLVSAVMDGVAAPELLLSGVNSEHQGSYSPQQLSDLASADAVFIIGDNLEVKLGELSGGETVRGHDFVKMAFTPDITTYAIRKGGAWEVDADAPAAGYNADPHIWLDPENAKIMVQHIAEILVDLDPSHAAQYDANARDEIAKIEAVETRLKAELFPLKGKPFIVFHDAYQYFEKRFGLNAVGSITDYAAAPASAARIAEIRHKVISSQAVCVFKEPQFSDAAVTTIIEGNTARIGVLDPIGAQLTPGAGAYEQLLSNLAQNLKACLNP